MRKIITTTSVTLSGKRLFADGTPASGWTLTDSKIAATGVIIGTYEPAGEIKKGSFAE
jgi:hypothetical protein